MEKEQGRTNIGQETINDLIYKQEANKNQKIDDGENDDSGTEEQDYRMKIDINAEIEALRQGLKPKNRKKVNFIF